MITKKLLSYAAILAFAMSLGLITPVYAGSGESHDQNSVKRQIQNGKMNLAGHHHHHGHRHHHHNGHKCHKCHNNGHKHDHNGHKHDHHGHKHKHHHHH